MIVYIVFVGDEEGESQSIHAIYQTEEAAATAVQELESRLGEEMIAFYESHEVLED